MPAGGRFVFVLDFFCFCFCLKIFLRRWIVFISAMHFQSIFVFAICVSIAFVGLTIEVCQTFFVLLRRRFFRAFVATERNAVANEVSGMYGCQNCPKLRTLQMNGNTSMSAIYDINRWAVNPKTVDFRWDPSSHKKACACLAFKYVVTPSPFKGFLCLPLPFIHLSEKHRLISK